MSHDSVSKSAQLIAGVIQRTDPTIPAEAIEVLANRWAPDLAAMPNASAMNAYLNGRMAEPDTKKVIDSWRRSTGAQQAQQQQEQQQGPSPASSFSNGGILGIYPTSRGQQSGSQEAPIPGSAADVAARWQGNRNAGLDAISEGIRQAQAQEAKHQAAAHRYAEGSGARLAEYAKSRADQSRTVGIYPGK